MNKFEMDTLKLWLAEHVSASTSEREKIHRNNEKKRLPLPSGPETKAGTITG
jgi:hypothetical protein